MLDFPGLAHIKTLFVFCNLLQVVSDHMEIQHRAFCNLDLFYQAARLIYCCFLLLLTGFLLCHFTCEVLQNEYMKRFQASCK